MVTISSRTIQIQAEEKKKNRPAFMHMRIENILLVAESNLNFRSFVSHQNVAETEVEKFRFILKR